MKVLLDTCLLYPDLTREVLIRLAQAGLFQPFWSARIFEEWRRRALRDGEVAEARAQGEQARLSALFAKAKVTPPPDAEARHLLPDPADRHVLAAAVAAQADVLLTFNLRDFPAQELDPFAIRKSAPDGFLCAFLPQHGALIGATCAAIAAELGHAGDLRGLLKRAQMPQLGKRLAFPPGP